MLGIFGVFVQALGVYFSSFLTFRAGLPNFSSLPIKIASHEASGSQYRTKWWNRGGGLWLC